jgi:hypothetical protein
MVNKINQNLALIYQFTSKFLTHLLSVIFPNERACLLRKEPLPKPFYAF